MYIIATSKWFFSAVYCTNGIPHLPQKLLFCSKYIYLPLVFWMVNYWNSLVFVSFKDTYIFRIKRNNVIVIAIDNYVAKANFWNWNRVSFSEALLRCSFYFTHYSFGQSIVCWTFVWEPDIAMRNKCDRVNTFKSKTHPSLSYSVTPLIYRQER